MNFAVFYYACFKNVMTMLIFRKESENTLKKYGTGLFETGAVAYFKYTV